MRSALRYWLGLAAVALVLTVPRLLLAQDGRRLSGPEILNALEPSLILLLPPALFSLAARTIPWVTGWSDGTRRVALVLGQVGVAALVFWARGSLDEGTVTTLLPAIAGILTGLTVPAPRAAVAKMATKSED